MLALIIPLLLPFRLLLASPRKNPSLTQLVHGGLVPFEVGIK